MGGSSGTTAERPYGKGRVSRQRHAIAQAARRMGRAFTVHDLLATTQAGGVHAGLATVYRAVAAMEEAGWIERVGARGPRTLYALCPTSRHHHHLVCTACGAVVSTDCPLEGADDRALRTHGFTVTDHEITLYGLCLACGSAANVQEGVD